MKKIVLLLLIITLVGSLGFVMAACGGNSIIPAPAWSNYEELTYEIKEDGVVVGTLVTTIERLASGDVNLKSVREAPFTISASSTRGMKYTQIATDLDDNVIMKSESIMNGFTSIASYKMVKYKDKDYEAKGYLDGKYFRRWINGVEEKKIKVGSDYVDNELLYASFRVYSELDNGYSRSVKVIDSLNGTIDSFTMQATTERKSFTLNFLTEDSEEVQIVNLDAIVSNIFKSSAPAGNGITVWYTEASFKLKEYGTLDESYHIPVMIKENNMTYTLKLAKAFQT